MAIASTAGPFRVTGSLLAVTSAAMVALGASGLEAQAPPIPTPLTYDAALQVATTRNLGLDAARRARLIREAAIRAAGQSPNPGVTFEVGRDTPHEVVSFSIPIEIGGVRSRRINVAKEELRLADVDVLAELRAVRRELRQAFFTLIAADERQRIADSVLDISRRFRDAAQARFDTGAAPRLEVL